MKLQKPTEKFIGEILQKYSLEVGHGINDKLQKLFKDFNDEENKFDVLIKVAALNSIYSTAITNLGPVVKQINDIAKQNSDPEKNTEWVSLVDKLSIISWENEKKGRRFKRKNLSFASKYVHFLSGREIPIYDSYIWIVIKGYLGQHPNEKVSFSNPIDYEEFYSIFKKFIKLFELEEYSIYEIDKFLWYYGKSMIEDIANAENIDKNKAKSELKNRIRNWK